MKNEWKNVSKNDVVEAIKKYDNEGLVGIAKSTFLVYENRFYPAKYIRGLAFQIATKKSISSDKFTGGIETKRFFENLGFKIEYHNPIQKNKISKKETIKDTNPQSPIIEPKSNHGASVEKQLRKVAKLDVKKDMSYEISAKKQLNETNENNIVSISLPNEKIKISSKNVTQQKNALQILLNRKFNGDIVCEKTFPWLKTPTKFDPTYQKLIDSLKNYRGDTQFARQDYGLRCDFVCESQKIIIEYDERQHFSVARKLSLESYKDEIQLFFNANLWIKACEDISAKDNNPKNRDEFRAYYDSVRDIEASRHGYKLIRILHFNYDWTSENAEEQLNQLLMNVNDIASKRTFQSYIDDEPKLQQKENAFEREERDDQVIEIYKFNSKKRTREFNLKIGLWLQDYEDCAKFSFNKMVKKLKGSCDLLVFPEDCFFPGIKPRHTGKYEQKFLNDRHSIVYKINKFSKKIGIPVIYGGMNLDNDNQEIYNFYINPFATSDETAYALYIKHTATKTSVFDMNYDERFHTDFPVIKLRNAKLGMTICYDCNHSMFSRMYGINDIDIIVNSTGGNVVYQKWQHFNKVRAIENNCFSLCVMGDGVDCSRPSFTYAFTPQGGDILPFRILGDIQELNYSGNVYIYTIDSNNCHEQPDISLQQYESYNKNVHYFLNLEYIDQEIDNYHQVNDSTFVKKIDKYNLVLIFIDNEDILKPEIASRYIFNTALNDIENKVYCIVNYWNKNFDASFYENQLSDVLKVRAVENFIAVVHISEYEIKCFQSGLVKNIQSVAYDEENGGYGLDFSRMGGPEKRWKDSGKTLMKQAWRKGYELIIDTCYNNSN